MSHKVLEPEVIKSHSSSSDNSPRWMTVIFDNDTVPRELVVLTILAQTGCTVEEAEIEVWEAEKYGKAPIHFADKEFCTKLAAEFSRIKVKAEVHPEWAD
jgi:protocatechuate 3,4-dioxygenase beta subunit